LPAPQICSHRCSPQCLTHPAFPFFRCPTTLPPREKTKKQLKISCSFFRFNLININRNNSKIGRFFPSPVNKAKTIVVPQHRWGHLHGSFVFYSSEQVHHLDLMHKQKITCSILRCIHPSFLYFILLLISELIVYSTFCEAKTW
jgi:hypothetical protein